MILSVIIPTHNSEQTLERCLNSLISQTYPREKFEIIVVDDGSNDDTIQLAKKHDVDKIINTEPCFQGKARNIGAKNAKTNYLAFIDSDCEAKDGWIKSIVENLPKVNAMTGPIDNGNPQSLAAWAEYFVEFGKFHKFNKRSKVRWIPGCNNAVIRDIFLKTGGFVEKISSEDAIFSEFLRRDGIEPYFIPEAGINHLCRTNMRKVLANSELIGQYTIRAVNQVPSIPYSSLLKSRWLLPAVFFGRLAKSIHYAISGKKTRQFFLSLPLVILCIFSFCKGIWKEL